ncbi:MAG: type II toxin-antitoxin system HipA family toxin YjjJ [Verrucomicrobia bacterium]|nr:type II toxin-antitoxin system HipA family toxin YjjJ [Verrucomicrobiota bacterium]
MLAAAFRVERSTISRALALPEVSPQVVRLGATRGATYALRRLVRGLGDTFPIRRIDALGRAHDWAQLVALHGGWQIVWADSAVPDARLAGLLAVGGYAEGFPFFLGELRPQGFIGRAMGRALSATLNLPPDPRGWSDDDTLVYLQAAGDDLPGDIIVGDRSLARFHQRLVENAATLPAELRSTRYPELAAAATSSGQIGSSVEGEQPKFLLPVREQGTVTHVLVKFTDSLSSASGRRWADLLAAEAQAQAILHAHGECEAVPRLLDAGGRRFLETPRFDRIGAHGRRGVTSLRALHDAYPGPDTNQWPAAVVNLHALGLIDDAALRSVRLRHAFGQLIGNSDMHFGNLSFWFDGGLPLSLAPAYDTLPMQWAPVPGNAAPEPEFAPPLPVPAEREIWLEASSWAVEFWRQVAVDAAVSPEFSVLARSAADKVERMRGLVA